MGLAMKRAITGEMLKTGRIFRKRSRVDAFARATYLSVTLIYSGLGPPSVVSFTGFYGYVCLSKGRY